MENSKENINTDVRVLTVSRPSGTVIVWFVDELKEKVSFDRSIYELTATCRFDWYYCVFPGPQVVRLGGVLHERGGNKT